MDEAVLPAAAQDFSVSIDDAESKLIEQVRRDPTAFGQLYRRHHDAIARHIHRRVGDEHVTEDLVADVFISAMRGFDKYRPLQVPLRSWLYRIATNRVNRWARNERSRAMLRFDAEHDAAATAQADEHAERERARTALLTLAPRYQAVLSLHYLDGLSIEEIAIALACSIGTVKSRLHRGREKLRKRLTQRRPST